MMGLLHFDQEEYKKLDKLRKKYGAGYAIASSTATAIVTLGITSPMIGISARKRYIAQTKLKLIRAELQKRDIELHTERTRDFLIPWAKDMATLGLHAVVSGY
ncbi:hypothetical protein GGR58DRAFT_501139 [Xylaria digitata]|nr:hypothetical protein GGR58DRAFT_501139 [Xylaria digitata]